MHALRQFIEDQMRLKDYRRPTDLVKASGLSKQQVSWMLNDNRDRLGEMPEPATIDGLSRAFSVPPEAIRIVAAQALGVIVDSPVQIASVHDVTDADLIRELGTRLRDCAPVIRPLDITALNEAAPAQLTDLMNDLRKSAAVSAANGLEYRAMGELHLEAYLKELFARALADRPTNDGPQSQPDPARPSDPRGHA